MADRESIWVALIEDDADIRESLALIIDGTAGFSCSGRYADCETALADLPRHPPDVLLMDIELPGVSGIEGVRQVRELLPEVDILMLTVHEDDASVFDSLCAGACGYLTKNTPPGRLLRAIEEVRAGGAPMSTSIARMVIGSFQRSADSPLSGRETEVLTLLCQGRSYKMIADALCISTDTVRSHIKSIYRKLEVRSNAEAVARALREGLVRP